MPLSEGGSIDDTQPDSATTTPPDLQRPVFDIEAFLGTEDHHGSDDQVGIPRWRRKLTGRDVRKGLGEIGVGIATGMLKGMVGTSLIFIAVVFVVLGPNAPWGRLTVSILRGGPSDANAASCEAIGDWFALFDDQTERISLLEQEAGDPTSWDSVTIAKLEKLLPIYMDDWLTEMKKHEPPPEGKRLSDVYISFLENFEAYVFAIQDGDSKAQKYYQRELTLIMDELTIESRYVSSLCL